MGETALFYAVKYNRPHSLHYLVLAGANVNVANHVSDNYKTNYDTAAPPTQDVLLQKLNYMISLLEEQQDEKTNNVTEEVVLYSFLGIFIIFIVDSFAKVGKYVR